MILVCLMESAELWKKEMKKGTCICLISCCRSLQDVLDYNEADLEEVFALNFEVRREVFGEVRVQPLKPGGENIPVTQENK